MKTRFWLATLVLLLMATVSFAQTADEIIGKYIEAVGGEKKLNSIKSIKIESDVEMMGNKAPSVTTILNGQGFLSETSMSGTVIKECFTKEGGWVINPMMGSGAVAMPDDQYKMRKEQIDIGAPFITYKKNGEKMTLLGKEMVLGKEAHKIKHTSKDGLETIYYFDPATHYNVRIVRSADVMGQPTTVTIDFSDFTKTEHGLVMAYRTEVDLGQFGVTSVVKSIEMNPKVDPAIFEMPK